MTPTAELTAYRLPLTAVVASPRILALDLATTTGWALHASGVLTSGSQNFARYPGSKSRAAEHVGEPYAKFGRWVRERIREDKPEVIVYEEVRRWSGFSAAHCFGGFRGMLFAQAAVVGVRVVGFSPSEVKKFWTGKGNAKKPAMIAATLARLGIEAVDDNESDAIALLYFWQSRAGTGRVECGSEQKLTGKKIT